MDVSMRVTRFLEKPKTPPPFPGDASKALVSMGNYIFNYEALRVEFLRYRFDGSFVIADAAHDVLGRNVLNLLGVGLDGPRRTWSA